MMHSHRDPKGYYAALGLGTDADADEVKAAYRLRAKAVHPDRNTSTDASAAFQTVVEAYRVLHDPVRRAEYDAQGDTHTVAVLTDDPAGPIEPLSCGGCGKVTAQPRYVVFHQVRSMVILSRLLLTQGIFCRDCAERAAVKASTRTWALGWWGLTGPIHTIMALLRNLRGGDMPKTENLRILLHQARAFLWRGDNDIAWSLAEQARDFAGDPAQLRQVESILKCVDPPARRLKNRWGLWSHAFVVQLLPLMALALALGVGGLVALTGTVPTMVSAGITVQPAAAGETRHVAVEVLKLRQAPGNTQPVISLLDRFTTVAVLEAVPDSEWVMVKTPSGVTGFVPGRFLFAGAGAEPKGRWCAEQKGDQPANGTVLARRTGGEHLLHVVNQSGSDAVVRLKTFNGKTVLAFFVVDAAEATIDGIPDGNFRAVFATGRDYSRACGLFLRDMQTFIVPTAQGFRTSGASTETTVDMTLVRPGTAPGQSRPITIEHFLD